MNNEVLVKSLCDAFEILKDSWEQKSDAISKCIAETAKYDPDIAIDMWLYLLKKHKASLKTENGAGYILNVEERLFRSFVGLDNAAVQLIPAIMKKPDFYDILFGKTYVIDNWYQTEFLTYCFTYALTKDNPEFTYEILNIYNSNKYKNSFTIGQFISSSLEKLNYAEDDITESNKEVLMSFLEKIDDRKERAESLISILSL